MAGNWTTKEIEWMRQTFPHVGIRRAMEFLGRTVDSIRCKAVELGLRQGTPHIPWPQKDLEILRDSYARRLTPDEIMVRLPGRTKKAIDARANILGIRRAPKAPRPKRTKITAWTPDMDRRWRELCRPDTTSFAGFGK